MFQVSRVSDNRIDIMMGGKLDADHMRVALDDLLNESQGIENGLMLFDVVDYHLPSLGAILIELSRLPEMFRWIKRFHRAAVLADENWLRKIGEFKGDFLPGLEIKVFTRGQREEAVLWLEHVPPIL